MWIPILEYFIWYFISFFISYGFALCGAHFTCAASLLSPKGELAMPNGFSVYYRGRHLKGMSQNRLLLTPEKSLTMKRHRSPPNNSNGIFSVSFPYRFRIVSVLFPYCFRIVLLLFSYWEAETIRKQYGNDTESNEWGTVEQGWLILLLSNFLRQWQNSNKLLWVSTCHLSHYRLHLSNSNKFDCIRFAR